MIHYQLLISKQKRPCHFITVNMSLEFGTSAIESYIDDRIDSYEAYEWTCPSDEERILNSCFNADQCNYYTILAMTAFENRLKYDHDKDKVIHDRNAYIESMKHKFETKFVREYLCYSSKRVAFAHCCYSTAMSLNAYAKLDIDWNMFVDMIKHEEDKYLKTIVAELDSTFVSTHANAMILKFEQYIKDLKNCGDKSRMKYYGLIVE